MKSKVARATSAMADACGRPCRVRLDLIFRCEMAAPISDSNPLHSLRLRKRGKTLMKVSSSQPPATNKLSSAQMERKEAWDTQEQDAPGTRCEARKDTKETEGYPKWTISWQAIRQSCARI
eukprot:6182688-Pleurochrysis_carterae.AAC.2